MPALEAEVKVASSRKLARRRLLGAVRRHRTLSAAGLSERLFARLFTGLVYPQIWEDPEVDMAALEIRPGDRIVTIASGGSTRCPICLPTRPWSRPSISTGRMSPSTG